MGPDPEVGVGRGEESPIWDWKSLRSRDGAGGARPTVAGRKGRSSGPCAARLPARLPPSGSCLAGLSSRWVRGALGGRSCLVQTRGTRCPGAPGCGEIMEGVSRVRLFSLPLCLQYGDLPLNYIFILSAILAAYMICKRLPGNGGGCLGVLSAEAPRGPGLGSCRFSPLSLPPFAPCCLSELPPSSLPAPRCRLLGNRAGLDN